MGSDTQCWPGAKMNKKLIAKNVTDSFWIVQSDGEKVGNIEIDADGVVMKQGSVTERFARLEDLQRKYPVEFVKYSAAVSPATNDALDYPTRTAAYNAEWDIQLQLPLYTTEPDSRSKRCAGFYIVNQITSGWTRVWCPKLLAIRRNQYMGPFTSLELMQAAWDQLQAQGGQI